MHFAPMNNQGFNNMPQNQPMQNFQTIAKPNPMAGPNSNANALKPGEIAFYAPMCFRHNKRKDPYLSPICNMWPLITCLLYFIIGPFSLVFLCVGYKNTKYSLRWRCDQCEIERERERRRRERMDRRHHEGV